MPEPRFRRAAALAVVVVVLAGCGDRPGPLEPREAPTRAGTAAPAEGSPSAASSTTPPATDSYEALPFVPSVYGDWLTRVPDRIRTTLEVALPEDGGDFTRGSSGVRFEFCEVQGFAADDVLDRAVVSASGPEYGEARDLRVFADDRAAHRLVGHVLAVLGSCPHQQDGVTTWRHEVRPSHLVADESFTVVQTFETHGLVNLGASWWEVVRVGNAVLLTGSGGEWMPGPTLDGGIRHHAADVAPVVEAMCVFGADPCQRAPVPGTASGSTVVGPHGLGGIALGDDESTIEAIGGRVTGRRTASGCRIVDLWVNDAPDLVGNLEPGLGLSVIHVRTAGRTDRGVGIGSPFREVVAAYPGGQGDRQLYAGEVAGYDDRHWRFWFDRDRLVDEFTLLLDEQHCGG